MRVLLIAPDFPPVLNSAARLFFELAEDLSHLGHKVRVLTRIPGKKGQATFSFMSDAEDSKRFS